MDVHELNHCGCRSVHALALRNHAGRHPQMDSRRAAAPWSHLVRLTGQSRRGPFCQAFRRFGADPVADAGLDLDRLRFVAAQDVDRAVVPPLALLAATRGSTVLASFSPNASACSATTARYPASPA